MEKAQTQKKSQKQRSSSEAAKFIQGFCVGRRWMNCRSSGADNHFTFMFDALATGFRKNEIVEEVSTPISISYTPASHSWSALQTEDPVLQNSHPFASTWSPEFKKSIQFLSCCGHVDCAIVVTPGI